MADLSLCSCDKKQESDPAGHAETCKFRLRYDQIEMQVPLTPEELLTLVHGLQLGKAMLLGSGSPDMLDALLAKLVPYAAAGQRMRAGEIGDVLTEVGG